jgi:hypothetical protein
LCNFSKAIYEKEKKAKLDMKRATKVNHQGRWVVGVMLDDSHGAPIGTLEMSSVSEVSIEQNAQLLKTGDDGDDVDQDRVDEVWEGATACLRTKVRFDADGNVLLKGPSAANGSDSEDDSSLINSVWGGFLFKSKITSRESRALEDGESLPTESKAASKKRAGPDISGRPKSKAKAKPKPSDQQVDSSASSSNMIFSLGKSSAASWNAVPAAGAGKLTKELDRSDTVLLQVSQTKTALTLNTSVGSVTEKSLTMLSEKVAGRLSDDLVGQYRLGWEAGKDDATHRGVQILEKLNEAAKDIKAMLPVVTALHDDSASPEWLHSCMVGATASGIEYAECADSILFGRSLTRLADDRNWDAYLSSFDPSSQKTPYTIHAMDSKDDFEEIVKQFQRTWVVKAVCDLLLKSDTAEKPDATLESVGDLKELCTMIAAKPFLKDGLTAEIFDDLAALCEIASATLCPDGVVAAIVETALKRLERKSGEFFKAVSFFPTGQRILSMATAIVEAEVRDQQITIEIDSAVEMARNLKEISFGCFFKDVAALDCEIAVPTQARLLNSYIRCRRVVSSCCCIVNQRRSAVPDSCPCRRAGSICLPKSSTQRPTPPSSCERAVRMTSSLCTPVSKGYL